MNTERHETEPTETNKNKIKQAEDKVFKCKDQLYALSLSFAAFSFAEEQVEVDLAFWCGLQGICEDIADKLSDAYEILYKLRP